MPVCGGKSGGQYLVSLGVSPKDFTLLARRGNQLSDGARNAGKSVRLRNQMALERKADIPVHLPDGEQMFIYDASVKYQQQEGVLADYRGQRIWFRIVA